MELRESENSCTLLYWVDKYNKGYRSGPSHASMDGETTLCGRKMTGMGCDGGYHDIKQYDVECKSCKKKIELQAASISIRNPR